MIHATYDTNSTSSSDSDDTSASLGRYSGCQAAHSTKPESCIQTHSGVGTEQAIFHHFRRGRLTSHQIVSFPTGPQAMSFMPTPTATRVLITNEPSLCPLKSQSSHCPRRRPYVYHSKSAPNSKTSQDPTTQTSGSPRASNVPVNEISSPDVLYINQMQLKHQAS